MIRKCIRRMYSDTAAAAVILTAVLTAAPIGGESPAVAQQGEVTMPQPEHYFLKLIPTRAGFADGPTEEELQAIGTHFEYLMGLTAKKSVILAGPCQDPFYAAIVLRVESREAALRIAENDPTVLGGHARFEIQPLSLQLLAHHVPAERYVTEPDDRILTKEIVVVATLDDVWHCWTTDEGIRSFLTPTSRVELRVGGPFEIYFMQDAPCGQRGTEDCRVLSFLPRRMLSFEWNAPPSFGDLRQKHTHVVIWFDELAPEQVKVTLSQLGWGKGEDWDRLYEYFDPA